MKTSDKTQRIGTIVENISGFKMKCVDYRNSMDIDVEFLDDGNIVKNVQWNNFVRGKVKKGSKKDCNKYADDYHQYTKNCQRYTDDKKEYNAWQQMLRRSFDKKLKMEKPTYKDVTCCKEWLNYKNFYNWLTSQENYNIWKTLKWSAIDKDILNKRNKIYSPENCLLVPVNVNNLFVKHDALRGNYPIGVFLLNDRYIASCTNPLKNRIIRIGSYDTVNEAFVAYKKYKEDIIKEIADIEYKNGTITKKCRDAMYDYIVEIDD